MALYSNNSSVWEQPIFSTKAHVFQIDPVTKKKWLPVSSEAVSISFYYDSQRSSYRIISVDNNKAIINSTILPSMTFTKTSQKFGQWSDSQANTVYGLGFSTEADCTKFVEKFRDVKELVKSTSTNGGAVDMNGSLPHGIIEPSSSTANVRTTSQVTSSGQGSTETSPSNAAQVHRQSSDSGQLDQLKYENDRLKIALAQSSANAKKWEVELQTLKNNNARLTTALQESNSNVDEWKKQLAAYKEESLRMRKRVAEVERNGGGGEPTSQLRLTLAELEQSSQRKDQDITVLKRQVQELSHRESETEKLKLQLQDVRDENKSLQVELSTLQAQSEQHNSRHSVMAGLQHKLESAVGEIQRITRDMGSNLV